jgi:hypothetical protein
MCVHICLCVVLYCVTCLMVMMMVRVGCGCGCGLVSAVMWCHVDECVSCAWVCLCGVRLFVCCVVCPCPCVRVCLVYLAMCWYCLVVWVAIHRLFAGSHAHRDDEAGVRLPSVAGH